MNRFCVSGGLGLALALAGVVQAEQWKEGTLSVSWISQPPASCTPGVPFNASASASYDPNLPPGKEWYWINSSYSFAWTFEPDGTGSWSTNGNQSSASISFTDPSEEMGDKNVWVAVNFDGKIFVDDDEGGSTLDIDEGPVLLGVLMTAPDAKITGIEVKDSGGGSDLSISVTPSALQLASAKLYGDSTNLATLKNPGPGNFNFPCNCNDLLGKSVSVQVLPVDLPAFSTQKEQMTEVQSDWGPTSKDKWNLVFKWGYPQEMWPVDVLVNLSYVEMRLGKVQSTGKRSFVGPSVAGNNWSNSLFLYSDPLSTAGIGTIVMTGNLTFTLNGPAGATAYTCPGTCGGVIVPKGWAMDRGATPSVRFWLTGNFKANSEMSAKAVMTGWDTKDATSPHNIAASDSAP
jgi:hypothetical protein